MKRSVFRSFLRRKTTAEETIEKEKQSPHRNEAKDPRFELATYYALIDHGPVDTAVDNISNDPGYSSGRSCLRLPGIWPGAEQQTAEPLSTGRREGDRPTPPLLRGCIRGQGIIAGSFSNYENTDEEETSQATTSSQSQDALDNSISTDASSLDGGARDPPVDAPEDENNKDIESALKQVEEILVAAKDKGTPVNRETLVGILSTIVEEDDNEQLRAEQPADVGERDWSPPRPSVIHEEKTPTRVEYNTVLSASINSRDSDTRSSPNHHEDEVFEGSDDGGIHSVTGSLVTSNYSSSACTTASEPSSHVFVNLDDASTTQRWMHGPEDEVNQTNNLNPTASNIVRAMASIFDEASSVSTSAYWADYSEDEESTYIKSRAPGPKMTKPTEDILDEASSASTLTYWKHHPEDVTVKMTNRKMKFVTPIVRFEDEDDSSHDRNSANSISQPHDDFQESPRRLLKAKSTTGSWLDISETQEATNNLLNTMACGSDPRYSSTQWVISSPAGSRSSRENDHFLPEQAGDTAVGRFIKEHTTKGATMEPLPKQGEGSPDSRPSLVYSSQSGSPSASLEEQQEHSEWQIVRMPSFDECQSSFDGPREVEESDASVDPPPVPNRVALAWNDKEEQFWGEGEE